MTEKVLGIGGVFLKALTLPAWRRGTPRHSG
jgi:hypothetical protein